MTTPPENADDGARPPRGTGRRREDQERDAELRLLADLERHYLARPSALRDLDPVTAAAAELTRSAGAVLLFLPRPATELAIEGASGLDEVRERSRLLASVRRMGEWIVSAREAAVAANPAADPRFSGIEPYDEPLTGVPVLIHGQAEGALIVFGTAEGERLALLRRVAALAGHLWFERRLVNQLGQSAKRLKEMERERHRLARLAGIGSAARDVAGTALRSLADMGAFARRVARDLPTGELNREYLDAIVGEIDRLERLLEEQRDLASLGETHLRMEDLNALLEEVERSFAEPLTKKKVRLIRRLAAGLPTLLIDAEQFRPALARMMGDLVQSVPLAGRIKIETKRAGESVLVVLAADTPRTAGDAMERLFAPFLDADHPGAGPIGALVRKVVQEHGGEVGVRCDADWPTQYTLTLPIKPNEERRRRGPDRRAA